MYEQFEQEHNAIPKTRSGAAANNYEPHWALYQNMLFVLDTPDLAPSTGNLSKRCSNKLKEMYEENEESNSFDEEEYTANEDDEDYGDFDDDKNYTRNDEVVVVDDEDMGSAEDDKFDTSNDFNYKFQPKNMKIIKKEKYPKQLPIKLKREQEKQTLNNFHLAALKENKNENIDVDSMNMLDLKKYTMKNIVNMENQMLELLKKDEVEDDKHFLLSLLPDMQAIKDRGRKLKCKRKIQKTIEKFAYSYSTWKNEENSENRPKEDFESEDFRSRTPIHYSPTPSRVRKNKVDKVTDDLEKSNLPAIAKSRFNSSTKPSKNKNI